MKKAMFKILLAGVLLAFISGNAFAVDCDSTVAACDNIPDGSGGGSGITLKVSPNVQVGYSGASNAYAIASWNSAGSKGYGADSIYQGLYVTKADISTVPSLPTSLSAGFDSSVWAEVGK